MDGRCDWPGCSKLSTCIYLGKELCDNHWDNHMGSEDRKIMTKSLEALGITDLYGKVGTYEDIQKPVREAEFTGADDSQTLPE